MTVLDGKIHVRERLELDSVVAGVGLSVVVPA